jgi:chaperonin GroEL (HSP60 family)
MDLNQILDMWENHDCKIEKDMTEASISTPTIHAKYLRLYNNEKGKLLYYEMEQKKLLKKKFLYYEGKLTQEEIDAEGWDYDPFNGMKILKGQMNYYYDADEDIQKSEAKILLQKQKIEILKEILENIKWRHQTIKNAIEWRKFESGI